MNTYNWKKKKKKKKEKAQQIYMPKNVKMKNNIINKIIKCKQIIFPRFFSDL